MLKFYRSWNGCTLGSFLCVLWEIQERWWHRLNEPAVARYSKKCLAANYEHLWLQRITMRLYHDRHRERGSHSGLSMTQSRWATPHLEFGGAGGSETQEHGCKTWAQSDCCQILFVVDKALDSHLNNGASSDLLKCPRYEDLLNYKADRGEDTS